MRSPATVKLRGMYTANRTDASDEGISNQAADPNDLRKKLKRHQIKRACPDCRISKAKCTDERPCPRCVRRHSEQSCLSEEASQSKRARQKERSTPKIVPLDTPPQAPAPTRSNWAPAPLDPGLQVVNARCILHQWSWFHVREVYRLFPLDLLHGCRGALPLCQLPGSPGANSPFVRLARNRPATTLRTSETRLRSMPISIKSWVLCKGN